VTALVGGARLGVVRLLSARAMVAPAVASLFVVTAAALERLVSPPEAADHALVGATFGLALPLLAFVTLGRATGSSRLDAAVWEVARHGGNRRLGAAGLVGVSALFLGLCGAALAALAVLVTRGWGDATLARDVLASAWVGLLGGICYGCWFALAAGFGATGGGRTAALLLDWVLGSGTTALAVLWPRGHLRNLLGAEPVLQMPQWSALVAVLLLSLVYAAAALWRTRR